MGSVCVPAIIAVLGIVRQVIEATYFLPRLLEPDNGQETIIIKFNL